MPYRWRFKLAIQFGSFVIALLSLVVALVLALTRK
ncbi:putative holin-like toxin [Alicyclobacillus vulcanalis]